MRTPGATANASWSPPARPSPWKVPRSALTTSRAERLVAEAGENLALSAALSDPATTIQALREAGDGLEAALNVLLTRAQDAGAIRTDLTAAKLHAIIAGVLTMEQRLPAESLGYGLTLVIDGLRPGSP